MVVFDSYVIFFVTVSGNIKVINTGGYWWGSFHYQSFTVLALAANMIFCSEFALFSGFGKLMMGNISV